LEKALSIMDIPMKDKGIILQKTYDLSLPRVMGDEGKLLQVFLNIIKNAVEAMKKGGSLTILTCVSREYVRQKGKPKRWAVVSVKDTGGGIPSEDIPKIFLPFYTKKKQGTGIGLALSKKIIMDHKGFIKVESHEGKGAAFNIYIPFGGE
jgi:signal transduction histidine kinase